MKRFFEDIQKSNSYYYTKGSYDLNDFVCFIALVMCTICMIVADIIFGYSRSDDIKVTIYYVVTIILTLPFIVNIIIKTVQIFLFKHKFKKIKEEGKLFVGHIIDEKPGKVLFKLQYTDIEKRSYYPIVAYYENGEYVKRTSKYSFSNAFRNGLSDDEVNIYVYKNNFIIDNLKTTADNGKSINGPENSSWSENKALRNAIIAGAITGILILAARCTRVILLHYYV